MQRGGTRICVRRRFSGRVDMQRRAISCRRKYRIQGKSDEAVVAIRVSCTCKNISNYMPVKSTPEDTGSI